MSDSVENGMPDAIEVPVVEVPVVADEPKKTTAKIDVQTSIFDVSTFDSVVVEKEWEYKLLVTSEQDVDGYQDFVTRVPDAATRAELLGIGYETFVRREVKMHKDGWIVKETELPFTGEIGDDTSKAFKGLVATLRERWGYKKDLPIEKRRELTERARKVIKASPELLEALTGVVA